MKNEEPMRNINPFGLRMQPELKAKIEAAAEKNRRSINAEIHARLEESFADENNKIPVSETDAAVQVLSRMYLETVDKIRDLLGQSRLSPMEQLELQHEQMTAKHLRHATARAVQVSEADSGRKASSSKIKD
jgi:hypothetical protein